VNNFAKVEDMTNFKTNLVFLSRFLAFNKVENWIKRLNTSMKDNLILLALICSRHSSIFGKSFISLKSELRIFQEEKKNLQ